MIFTLYESQSDQSNVPKGEPLARSLLDLGEFGDVPGLSSKSIPVSLNPKISSFPVAPQLTLTICFLGKKVAPGGSSRGSFGGDLYGGNGGNSHSPSPQGGIPHPQGGSNRYRRSKSFLEFSHSRESTMDMDEDAGTEFSYPLTEDDRLADGGAEVSSHQYWDGGNSRDTSAVPSGPSSRDTSPGYNLYRVSFWGLIRVSLCLFRILWKFPNENLFVV